jgi:hypothetical protein
MPSTFDDTTVLQRVRAEFHEMPGMRLTVAQAARLWHLDVSRSAHLLDTLVGDGVLRRNATGAYVMSTDIAHVRASRG